MQYQLIKNNSVLLNQPVLIEAFGRTGAQFISQLHYWIEKQAGVLHEGMRWIYNTEKEWGKQICLSDRQIRFYVKKFRDLGILFVQKLHPKKSDRTNYFTINYEKLFELVDFSHQEETSSSSGRDCLFYNTKITNKDINNKSEESDNRIIEPQVVSYQVEQVSIFQNISKKQKEGKEDLQIFAEILEPKSTSKIQNTTVQDMLAYWNNSFPKSEEKLSKNLCRQLMGAFIHRFENNMEKWQYYCAKIASSPYLMRDGFVLNLNWVLKFSTIDRILKNELGVKDIQFIPSIQTLETQAIDHIDGVGESDLCKQTRHLLLKKLGAATYVSWFTKIQFLETEKGRVIFKADNSFVENYINQKFGDLFCNKYQFLQSVQ